MQQSAFDWRSRRVLVTGGTGFLGSTLVEELLERGAEVIGLIRNRASMAAFTRHQLAGRIHIIHGRTEDLFRVHSALAVHDVQTMFHLAAREPIAQDCGTATVLDAVRRFNPRVPVVIAQRPTAPPISVSPVPLGIARFGELFGPGDGSAKSFVASAIVKTLQGERIAVSSDRPRDFVDVRDAADACLALAAAVAQRPIPHVHDATFSSGQLMAEREIADAIRAEIHGRPRLGQSFASVENPLGWQPQVNFSKTIADTLKWTRTCAGAASPQEDRPERRAA